MRYTISLVLAWGAILACQPDPHPSAVLRIDLLCEAEGAEAQAGVFAVLEDSKLKIAEMTQCEELSFARFFAHSVPADARAALKGMWYGIPSVLFVRQRADTIFFFQESLQEEYPYAHLVAEYRAGNFRMCLPTLPEHVTGLYAGHAGGRTYLLLLGLNGSVMEAEWWEVNGPMPEDGEISRILPVAQKLKLREFQLDMNRLHFGSELGTGIFRVTQEGLSIVLPKTAANHVLTLKRLEE